MVLKKLYFKSGIWIYHIFKMNPDLSESEPPEIAIKLKMSK